jgi:hypothetical protein
MVMIVVDELPTQYWILGLGPLDDPCSLRRSRPGGIGVAIVVEVNGQAAVEPVFERSWTGRETRNIWFGYVRYFN